jgi:hypothetical protein
MSMIKLSNLKIILISALAIRVIFSFYLSKFYYGDVTFTFGDTFSYVEPFLNLISNGNFTFDLANPDAYVYRGPVYPFFWGIHYLLFGESIVYKAVAVSQSLLDTATALLIYKILYKLGNSERISLLGAAIYAFNPIFFIYVPITGTESFATFLTVFIIFVIVNSGSTKSSVFLIGILLGVAVLTRQYLGILLPVYLCYFVVQSLKDRESQKSTLVRFIICILGFTVVVSPWHLRNLINHDINSFLKGGSTGYATNQDDFIAFQKFYELYFVDYTKIRNSVSDYGVNGLTPNDLPYTDIGQLKAADKLAFECGPSFHAWSGKIPKTKLTDYSGCKEEVVAAYQEIYKKTLEIAPWYFNLKQPFLNLYKTIFKSSLSESRGLIKDLVINSLFYLRTMVLMFAIFAIFLLPRRSFNVFMLYFFILSLYISFVLRQVEMRYLVQADAISVVFCMLAIQVLFEKYKLRLGSVG